MLAGCNTSVKEKVITVSEGFQSNLLCLSHVLDSHKTILISGLKSGQIVLGFDDTSNLVGHFVSSPRERRKRDRSGDEREGQGRKRNRNESEETEEIKTFPLYPYLLQG